MTEAPDTVVFIRSKSIIFCECFAVYSCLGLSRDSGVIIHIISVDINKQVCDSQALLEMCYVTRVSLT